MNFALPALVVFFVLLPGFIFRSLLRRAERTSLDYSPFGQVVSEAVVWSCVLHAFWLVGAEQLFGRELQADVLMRLLAADGVGQSRAAEIAAGQWRWIAGYFLSLLGFSLVAPRAVRWVVKALRWDRLHHPLSGVFRLRDAPWYYVLTGADFAKEDKPDLIAISAVVDVAGEPTLYYGLLDEFFVDQDGVLDRLVMQQVMRRPLTSDKPGSTPLADDASVSPPTNGSSSLDRFYPIDGDCFVLRYSEAITLNIEYIKLKREGEQCADDELDVRETQPSDASQPNASDRVEIRA
jgi:hypothetical protein